MKIRPANTRGFLPASREGKDNYQSYRSFSCMSYYDPKYTNWGPVITINDDRTKPGFITAWHEHCGMDIINYMVSGQCRHRDDQGNDNTAGAGQVQHFWCGKSIWHELSHEGVEPSRYLQIWILPNTIDWDYTPKYDFINRESGFSRLPVQFKNSKIEVWAGVLDQNMLTQNSYLLVLEGSCRVDGVELHEGDAVEIVDSLVEPVDAPHLLLFELK
jgi:redox-sensitive bicupin YhaK (pirin superfamily)